MQPASATVENVRLGATILAFAALIAGAAEIAFVEPADLAAHLSAKPVIFYVGPNVMYRSKHIPGAVYAGPGNKAEGIELLKGAVAELPRDRDMVIYCGCCPWEKCPNVQPAMTTLQEMGFTRVRVLHLPDNFKTNWIDKGYPVE
jgi:thiosulfate/3-mercaptopyruvate sulfurtransferase